MKDILYAPFTHNSPLSDTSLFSVKEAEKVCRFHKSLDEYKETQLCVVVFICCRKKEHKEIRNG